MKHWFKIMLVACTCPKFNLGADFKRVMDKLSRKQQGGEIARAWAIGGGSPKLWQAIHNYIAQASWSDKHSSGWRKSKRARKTPKNGSRRGSIGPAASSNKLSSGMLSDQMADYTNASLVLLGPQPAQLVLSRNRLIRRQRLWLHKCVLRLGTQRHSPAKLSCSP